MLNLSSYAGESSVYIAFRHHNVSDMFVLNIDDIIVSNVVGESASVTLTSSETQYATQQLQLMILSLMLQVLVMLIYLDMNFIIQ